VRNLVAGDFEAVDGLQQLHLLAQEIGQLLRVRVRV
jgi:hypothetical protein